MKEVDLIVSVLKRDPAARGYDDAHVRLATACDAAYMQLAQANTEIAKLKQEIDQLRAKAELLDQWTKDPNEYGAQMQRQRDAARAEVEGLTKVVRAGMDMAKRFRCEARAALNEYEEGAR